jgi:nitroreductase
MGPPQWADLGLWLQTVMLLLVEEGLGSCAQEAWSAWPQTVKQVAGIPGDHLLFCGLAIGWPDPQATVNAFANQRAPLEETVRFLD